MLKKQLVVACGGLPALVVALVAWRYVGRLSGFVPLPADDAASRLAFAARWLLIPGLTLLAGIIAAAQQRFYTDAIDGTRVPRSYSHEIVLRYNTNTVEQSLLVVILWPALAALLPRDQLMLVPAAAILFGVGRLTFWLGYMIHPLARAFGMALTAAPTVAGYVWLIVESLR
jgi:hypothetical protein